MYKVNRNVRFNPTYHTQHVLRPNRCIYKATITTSAMYENRGITLIFARVFLSLILGDIEHLNLPKNGHIDYHKRPLFFH